MLERKYKSLHIVQPYFFISSAGALEKSKNLSKINCQMSTVTQNTKVLLYHLIIGIVHLPSNTEIFEKEQSECKESSDDLSIRNLIFNVKVHHD